MEKNTKIDVIVRKYFNKELYGIVRFYDRIVHVEVTTINSGPLFVLLDI